MFPTNRLHHKPGNMQARREHMNQIDLAALTIRAWNAWIIGGTLLPMRMIDNDRTSAGFPRLKWA